MTQNLSSHETFCISGAIRMNDGSSPMTADVAPIHRPSVLAHFRWPVWSAVLSTALIVHFASVRLYAKSGRYAQLCWIFARSPLRLIPFDER
jgi:hypothetical protein